MNPSYDPTSEPQWGLVGSRGLANVSVHEPTASHTRGVGGSGGPYVCQLCGKTCNRLCDLNKHFKSHTRPFKCPFEACRYHVLGWPTEKELDRHQNDKHSMEPRTFSCLWDSCTYTSRRESNCKQHMEKVHGWNYVRSNYGYKDGEPSQQPVSDGDASHQGHLPESSLTIRMVPNLTVSPSPSAPENSPLPNSTNGPVPYGADVYIPWTSPVTRLRNNEDFLEEFTQKYTGGYQGDHACLRIPIDPQLCTSTPEDDNVVEKALTLEAAPRFDHQLRALTAVQTPQASPIVKTQLPTPLSEPSPFQTQCPWAKRECRTPRDAGSGPASESPAARGSRSGISGQLNRPAKRPVGFYTESDASQREDEPPAKRSKDPGGDANTAGDPRMICPFRAANPEIYDRDRDPKYVSCHTAHGNISVVVRHLGRPAHCLNVDNGRKSISSFGLENNEYGHPAAGLCKRCWRVFRDPEDFEAHFRSNCGVVSRSKREKYNILLDAFCRIDPSRARSSAEDSILDDSGVDNMPDAEGEFDYGLHSKSARGSLNFRGDEEVSRSEHDALAERVAALESMVQQIVFNQATPRIMPEEQVAMAQALASSSTPVYTQPAQMVGHFLHDFGARSHAVGERGDTNDSQNIMGGLHRRLANCRDQDTESIMAQYHSVATRSDSMSTVHRTSPVATNRHELLGGQPKAAASDSAYGTAASNSGLCNASQSQAGGAANMTQPGLRVGEGGGDEFAQDEMSQASSHARMIHQYFQPEEQPEVVMGRAGLFSTETDDMVSNYLNIDSQ